MRLLLRSRSARWSQRAYVAEGIEVVRSALEAAVPIEGIYLAVEHAGQAQLGAIRETAADGGVAVHELSAGVLGRVSTTVTPQPVLAVLPIPDQRPRVIDRGPTIVVCIDVRDPGNAGTVLRCADASGVDAVVFSGESVDPYNPKTVRASAGSVFHVPHLVWPAWQEVFDALSIRGVRRLGTVARGGTDYAAVDWCVPNALVLGNEATGLPASVQAALDGTVSIPMDGHAESLNVGVSCAVLCFEALRQRRLRGSPRSTMPPIWE